MGSLWAVWKLLHRQVGAAIDVSDSVLEYAVECGVVERRMCEAGLFLTFFFV